jgi:DNA-binding transcriptional LysR family regulator
MECRVHLRILRCMAGNGSTSITAGTHFDLRLAQHFVVLVEEGSFSKAAKRLFLSQSALTKQVQVLERTFANNMRFIDRGRRPWQLTPAGQEFLSMCQDVLGRATQGARRLTRSSTVKVGVTGSSDEGWPIARLTEATDRLTQHDAEFVMLHQTVCMQALQKGDVDVLITQPAQAVNAVCWRSEESSSAVDAIVQAIESVLT